MIDVTAGDHKEFFAAFFGPDISIVAHEGDMTPFSGPGAYDLDFPYGEIFMNDPGKKPLPLSGHTPGYLLMFRRAEDGEFGEYCEFHLCRAHAYSWTDTNDTGIRICVDGLQTVSKFRLSGDSVWEKANPKAAFAHAKVYAERGVKEVDPAKVCILDKLMSMSAGLKECTPEEAKKFFNPYREMFAPAAMMKTDFIFAKPPEVDSYFAKWWSEEAKKLFSFGEVAFTSSPVKVEETMTTSGNSLKVESVWKAGDVTIETVGPPGKEKVALITVPSTYGGDKWYKAFDKDPTKAIPR